MTSTTLLCESLPISNQLMVGADTVSRVDIRDALLRVIDTDTTVLVLHTSLPHLGIFDVAAKWEVLAALRDLSRRGITICVPSFTFSFCADGLFDIGGSSSETGIVADWLLELGEARRTAHPIYSFVILGPLADAVSDTFGETAFGSGSAFEFFEAHNATIVMMGCDWLHCTQFHRYEELSNVPYRFYKDFDGQIDAGKGPRNVSVKMYVRELGYDNENAFTTFVAAADRENVIKRTPLGGGEIQSATCADIKRISMSLLQNDPFAYVARGKATAYDHKQRQAATGNEPLRVALLGSSNLDPLGHTLDHNLQRFFPGCGIEIYVVPFGQYRQQIVDPSSELAAFQPRVVLALERAEDMTGETLGDTERLVDEYLGLLEALVQNTGATCFVSTLPRLIDPALGSAELEDEDKAGALPALNKMIRMRAYEDPSLRVFDLARLVEKQGYANAVDPRLELIGRIPFAAPFNNILAESFAGLLMAELGKTTRAIALDIDGTLWGGVLGEDGIEGIAVGGDYPGNAYVAFQKQLKQIMARGVALVLLSKNDELHVLEAFDRRQEMVLTVDDFVTHRINWHPKWQNLSDIAEEMSLGLESFLFIDDNPVERSQMAQFLPEVKVLDLPDDPAEYVETLLSSPYLECISITDEDKKRVRSYRNRANLERSRGSFDDLEAFYASLDQTVFIQSVEPATIARTMQLINKTNQFNTTTKRYTQTEIESLAEQRNSDVIVIGARDRFNDRENIGVAVVRWGDDTETEIDTFLLSCRALGRGIESAALGWIVEEGKRRGIGRLVGRIIPTERNAVVQSFFEDNGFSQISGEDDAWFLDVANHNAPSPDWVRVEIEL